MSFWIDWLVTDRAIVSMSIFVTRIKWKGRNKFRLFHSSKKGPVDTVQPIGFLTSETGFLTNAERLKIDDTMFLN